MDISKTQAVFRKRENGAAGAHGIEFRNEDHANAVRWDTQAAEEAQR